MIDNPKAGYGKVWLIVHQQRNHECPSCGKIHECSRVWTVNSQEGELIDEVYGNSRNVRLCGCYVARVEDLFKSFKQAQAECDKRNKKGAKDDRRDE